MSDRLKTRQLLENLQEGQVVGPVLLIEDADFFVMSSDLVEGVLEGKQQTFLEVEGRFQHADLKNHNGRVYPKTLWEKVLKDQTIIEQLQRGAMHGHLDHPEDGKTLVEKVSHIITGLRMDEKTGEVIGRARVLNNQWGNQLKSIFEAGGTVGISSRGSGSVKMMNGVNVVQEDFRLNTFDFVNVPSTPNAFPKPVGEHTVAQGKQLRNENLEESMSASLKKLAEVRNEVSILLTAQPEKLNEGGRAKYAQDLDAAEYKVNKLIAEDSGVESLAKPLLSEIAAKRGVVKSLDETYVGMTPPMVMQGTIGTNISERKCACGYPGCDCAAGVCECYNKMMGFTESVNESDFEDFDLDQFLAELEDDEDFEPIAEEEDDEEAVSITALAQHTRVAEKVYEADRSAFGQIIGALAARIRQMQSQAEPALEAQFEGAEELEALRAENARLKAVLGKVSESVRAAAEAQVNESVQPLSETAKFAAIDQIIAEEPKAKLWVSRLIKATTLEEMQRINKAAKSQILTERASDPSLPPRGAVKRAIAVDTARALDEGAALSQRIMSSMKSRNQRTLINRGGQTLEAESNIK